MAIIAGISISAIYRLKFTRNGLTAKSQEVCILFDPYFSILIIHTDSEYSDRADERIRGLRRLSGNFT